MEELEGRFLKAKMEMERMRGREIGELGGLGGKVAQIGEI